VLFLWFGYQQLAHPEMWVSYLPEWTGYFPIPGEMLVRLNGWFEVISAVFLLLGIYTRVIATILAAHLMFLAIEIGGAVGMRDGVLAMIGFAIALSPADEWTIDYKTKK
jgi:uncharacterized membrane protein YphA (DoxX/SURF4 family)